MHFLFETIAAEFVKLCYLSQWNCEFMMCGCVCVCVECAPGSMINDNAQCYGT